MKIEDIKPGQKFRIPGETEEYYQGEVKQGRYEVINCIPLQKHRRLRRGTEIILIEEETKLQKAIREAEEAGKRLEAVMKEEYKMDDQEFESEVEKRKIKEYIDANKQMWAQYPLMSAFDIVTLLSGTTEDILKLLAEKQLAEKQKELQEREVLPEDGINLTQMYKDAGVKDPIQADIEAMINALTGDMEKRRAVNHDFGNFSERMAKQWAQKELDNMRNVEPFSKDYWDARARKDAQDMKEGKVSNPYHWPVEMLTVEEIVEKYHITQETVEKLNQMVIKNNQVHKGEGLNGKNPLKPGDVTQYGEVGKVDGYLIWFKGWQLPASWSSYTAVPSSQYKKLAK